MTYITKLPAVGYLTFEDGSLPGGSWTRWWDPPTRERCEKYLGYVPERNGLIATFANEQDVTLFYLCCYKEELGVVRGYSGYSGTVGTSGYSGSRSGSTKPQGPVGISGYSGCSGIRGSTKTQGVT